MLSPAGKVLDTLNLGAQSAGVHGFDWAARASYDNSSNLTFRVTATSGATKLEARPR